MNMKRRPLVTGLLAALAVLSLAVGALLGAAVKTARDPALYMGKSRAVAAAAYGLESDDEITAAIGLTREAQSTLARQIAQGMCEDAFPRLDALSARENEHMQDVHGLIRRADRLRSACITFAAFCCIAMAWTGAQLARRRPVLIGAACGVAALALPAYAAIFALRAAGFDALFRGLHELLFTNDLWLLDPATDVLIRMMPQPLFERAALDVLARAAAGFALGAAMGTAVYTLLGGLMRRHLTERST